MLALGICNIANSFVSSMPVSGALSRGAVNNASGVKTTFGGVYTGIVVILALYLFTPYFSYIPKASLAAVIIAAVVFMVELQVIKPIWRTKSKWESSKNDLLQKKLIITTVLHFSRNRSHPRLRHIPLLPVPEIRDRNRYRDRHQRDIFALRHCQAIRSRRKSYSK